MVQEISDSPFLWLGQPVLGLLLDMDGTLAETLAAHGEAWEIWTRRRGIGVSRQEYISRYFGRSNRDTMLAIFPELEGDPAAVEELAGEREEIFLEMVDRGLVHPTPGVARLLERAEARGIPCAVASSAPRRNVARVLEAFGLAARLPVCVTMEDVERTKPDPDLFLEAARRLGVAAESCVVFEDSRFGLESGRRAGARTVAVLTLHTEDELRGEADLCVADFDALLDRPEWRNF
ncbi:MAG: beta-phosphoglucomutase [Candidatus Sumerlaeota bacterium]|nr:beta-phosphoglucomutase [Candidatus Sumerlaeota bacterium]